MEVRIRHSNDSWVYFEVIANNLIDDPNVKGVVINARDITKRKMWENALQESEEKYRDLVENINEVVYAVNDKGIVTYISPYIKTLLEYVPQELIGQNFSKFI